MKLFPCLLLSFFGLSSVAEQPMLRFEQLGAGAGMKENCVESIFEDHVGYLWIGTSNGLFRYDGYSCAEYKWVDGDSTSVQNNSIYALDEDSQNNLWVTYKFGGIFRYNRQSNSFSPINFVDSIMENKALRSSLRCIYEDNDQNIWVLNANGVAKKDFGDTVWHWYTHTLDSVPLKNIFSSSMCHTKDGAILMCLYGKPDVLVFDTVRNGFGKLPLHGKGTFCTGWNSILKVVEDYTGTIWIGTEESGLLKVDMKDSSYTQYRPENENARGLATSEIVDIFEDSKQNLWVGTVNGGLHLYDRTEDFFYRYNTETLLHSNLNSNTISKIAEDRNGNLWIGTHSGGVNILNYNKNIFKHYYGDDLGMPGVRGNVIACFEQTGDRDLWVGTDGGGLLLFDLETNKKFVFSVDNGLSSNVILDLEYDGSRYLWMATWGGGIIRFDTKTKKAENYLPGSGNSISYKHVKGICLADGLLWIATHGDGINIFDTEQEIFYTAEKPHPQYNFDYNIPKWGNKIVVDHKGRVWIATAMGLYKFAQGILSAYGTSFYADESFLQHVYDLFEDRDGDIWIAAKGLCKYSDELDSLVPQKTGGNELPELVTSVTKDFSGNFWLGSKLGIFKFDPRTQKVANFSVVDGIQSNTLTARAVFPLDNGNLVFGSNRGFCIFSPDALVLPPKDITTRIESCNIWHSTERETIRQNIMTSGTTSIAYENSRMISIGYLGLSLTYADKLNYACLLEGFDGNWHLVGDSREAVYTNLDPGDYCFKVKARIDQSEWSPCISEFRFTILEPWYLSWWFRFLLAAAVALSILLLYLWKTKSVRKQNSLLGYMVEEKTKELTDTISQLAAKGEELLSKNRELVESQDVIHMRNEELREMISLKDKLISVLAHDLRNAIASVMSFSGMLRRKHKELSDTVKYEYAELIDNAACKLHAKFSDLLDWVQTQSISRVYTPREISAEGLVRDALALAETAVKAKNIQADIASECSHYVYADPRMLSAIFRNVIGNAIKFTPQGGRIFVVVGERDDVVAVTVNDNGVGMSMGQLADLERNGKTASTKGTDGEVGSGYGLPLCYEFAKACDADISVQSKEGEGTRFSIFLKKAGAIVLESFSLEPKVTDSVVTFAGSTVLVVDDNPEMLRLLSDIFADRFSVETAINGKEAFAIATDLVPDIILSDIDMPEMNGRDLCRLLKGERLTSHIPVILITGQADVQQQLDGIGVGAYDYIVKPFDHDILKSKVLNALSNLEKMREHLKYQILSSPDPKDVPESKDEQLIRQVSEIVADNIRTPDLSVEFLADKVGMSRSHLYRKFKAIIGYSPVEYIRIFRIRKAAELLKSGRVRVSEAAYDVGFSDPKYFSSCFKKEFGINPSEYQSLGKAK